MNSMADSSAKSLLAIGVIGLDVLAKITSPFTITDAHPAPLLSGFTDPSQKQIRLRGGSLSFIALIARVPYEESALRGHRVSLSSSWVVSVRAALCA